MNWIIKIKKTQYIDKNEKFCDKCNIRSVPTFFIMNGKDLLGNLSGADKTKLSEMIVTVFNDYNKKLNKNNSNSNNNNV